MFCCLVQVHREMFPDEILHSHLEDIKVKTDDDRLQEVSLKCVSSPSSVFLYCKVSIFPLRDKFWSGGA